MYNCFKELSTDIVFNVLYIYIFFILFYIMYNIHVVKRFRAHCGFYAIENKLLLLIIIINACGFCAPNCLFYQSQFSVFNQIVELSHALLIHNNLLMVVFIKYI